MTTTFSKKHYSLLCFICISILVVGSLIIIGKKEDVDLVFFGKTRSQIQFAHLRAGDQMPAGPGDYMYGPRFVIPAFQKFYITVAEPNNWCSNEDCGLEGDLIATMGGWLQGENTYQGGDKPDFGLDLPENKNVKSIIVVGDQYGKIVGLYPNKKFKDVLAILRLYPELADFNFLKGVNEFKSLKVGNVAPLKPGESIQSDELTKFSVTHIPKDKKFYVYSLQKRRYDIGGVFALYENQYVCFLGAGCRYPEPDPPHDFLFDKIDTLGGWFLANDKNNTAMIKLFGLDPKTVLNGDASLVVVTDSKGVIMALHPQKTLSDIITILSQHPHLVNIQSLYQ